MPMAWSELFDASWKGMSFEFVSTDDGCDSAVVEHLYPYVDGAEIEEMGLGAWRTSGQAIFYGPDYETQLQQFLALVREGGAGEFVHPVFGSFANTVALLHQGSIRHDADNPDQVSISITFIESTPGAPFFSRTTTSQQSDAAALAGASAVAAASLSLSDVIDRLRAANPAASLSALRTAMTMPLAEIAAAEGVVLSWLDVVAYPSAWATDISSLAVGMLDMLAFKAGGDLGGDWSMAQANFDTLSGYGQASAVAPVSASATPTETQAVAAASVTLQVTSTVMLADAAGNVIRAESELPSMSPDALEAVCNAARRAIDQVISQVRGIYALERSRSITEPLKDQALLLQESCRAVIELRPPLITRTIDAPANMRLLAHLYYSDHERAEELYRLNGGRRPILKRGEVIRGYAL